MGFVSKRESSGIPTPSDVQDAAADEAKRRKLDVVNIQATGYSAKEWMALFFCRDGTQLWLHSKDGFVHSER